jgi:hypothetical protein
MSYLHAKRSGPRVPLRIPYNEYVAERQLLGVISDVSPDGLRVERLARNTGSRIVQVEFELPGTNELIWAKGELCFDRLRVTAAGLQPVRTSGMRLVAAASKHLRLMRDYVVELKRAMMDEDDALMRASAYRA